MSEQKPHPKTIAIATACLHAQIIALDTLMRHLLAGKDEEVEQRFFKLQAAMASLPDPAAWPRFIEFPDMMNATEAWLTDHLPGESAAEQISAVEYAIANIVGLFDKHSSHRNDDDPDSLFA